MCVDMEPPLPVVSQRRAVVMLIMADADDSYDFLALMPLLMKLREGYQLVMGNRFKGGIKPGRNAVFEPLFR